MRLAALISGGKDSLYAAYLAKQSGNELAVVVSLISENPDSYMWHVPNARLAALQAQLMNVPILQVSTKGEKEKELEDLRTALASLSNADRPFKSGKAKCPACNVMFECKPTGDCWCKTEVLRIPPSGDKCLCPNCFMKRVRIEGIVTGAVASNYQKSRIDGIAGDLGIASLAPLWQREPVELLREMINAGFEIIITAVAAGGLDESWLGRTLDAKAAAELIVLSKKHRFSPIGEGGEFETLVLDCPLFTKKIKVLEAQKNWNVSTRSGTFNVKKTELVNK